MDITALPFNRFIGIGRSDRDGAVLSLVEHERYTNHLGTVHASALLALAEATSGEFLVDVLGGLAFEVVPVVRRIEAKFKKPASGAVHSKLGDMGAAQREFLDALIGRGRALITIPVNIFDSQDVQVLNANVEWFVARKNENQA
jgi:hypothetical protein